MHDEWSDARDSTRRARAALLAGPPTRPGEPTHKDNAPVNNAADFIREYPWVALAAAVTAGTLVVVSPTLRSAGLRLGRTAARMAVVRAISSLS